MPNQEVAELRNRILGVLIQNARDQARVSRRECAAILGVSSAKFAGFEEGTKAISLPEIELLSRFLGVSRSIFDSAESLNSSAKATPLPNPELFLPLRHRIVGARLRQARQEAGRTQQDLAELLGCSMSVIADYEYGRRPVALADLEAVGRMLNVPLEYFADQDSEIGEWQRLQLQFDQFKALPAELREFVVRPINRSYVELAVKLSQMPAGSLRAIAEGLLEITY